jgi:hypothetical protein
MAGEPATGAVDAVAPHPSDPNILYIGTAGGGVWKTSNALDGSDGEDDDGDGRVDELDEVRWTSLTEQLPSSSISTLVFDPSDSTHQTLFAGTGKVSSAILSHLNSERECSRRPTGTWTVGQDADLIGKTVFAIAYDHDDLGNVVWWLPDQRHRAATQ